MIHAAWRLCKFLGHFQIFSKMNVWGHNLWKYEFTQELIKDDLTLTKWQTRKHWKGSEGEEGGTFLRLPIVLNSRIKSLSLVKISHFFVWDIHYCVANLRFRSKTCSIYSDITFTLNKINKITNRFFSLHLQT